MATATETVQKFNMFMPITKVDAVQRLVYGTLALEQPDRSGEILDYEASKALFQGWSDEIAKNTSGKSLGNVRAMHGKVAAGKLTEFSCDDINKAFIGCAKVVDDAEWQKVEEGVYTGFSLGGSYEKRWTDPTNPALKRYSAKPYEVSLVDLPCIPGATFEFIKAAGAAPEQRPFKAADTSTDGDGKDAETTEDTAKDKKAADTTAADDAKDTKNEKAAGPQPVVQKWISPTDGSVHEKKADAQRHEIELAASGAAKAAAAPATAALDALAKAVAGNDYNIDLGKMLAAKEQFTTDEFAVVERVAKAIELKAQPAPGDMANVLELSKRELKPAAVDTIVLKSTIFPVLDKATVEKGLWQVSRLACMLDDLCWFSSDYAFSQVLEDDQSAAAAKIKEAVNTLIQALRLMVVEETDELMTGDDVDIVEMAAGAVPHAHFQALIKQYNANKPNVTKAVGMLEKLGARNSKTDKQRIQKMHDITCELGSECAAAKAALGDDAPLELQKVTAEKDALTKTVGDLTGRVEELAKQFTHMMQQPVPAKGVVKVVNGAQALLFSMDKEGDGQDTANKAVEFTDEQVVKHLRGLSVDDQNALLMKAALRNGVKFGG